MGYRWGVLLSLEPVFGKSNSLPSNRGWNRVLSNPIKEYEVEERQYQPYNDCDYNLQRSITAVNANLRMDLTDTSRYRTHPSNYLGEA